MRKLFRSALVAVLLAVVGLVLVPSTASAAVGVERFIAKSTGGGVAKQVTAGCPTGLRVVGAEYSLTGTERNFAIFYGIVVTSTTVTAKAHAEVITSLSNWQITVTVYCDEPLAGYEVVAAVSPNDTNPEKVVVATCSPGKTVVGMAAAVDSEAPGRETIDEIIPTTNQVFTKAFMFLTGSQQRWKLTAFAVCASSLPGRAVIRPPEPQVFDSQNKSASASCPSGTTLYSTSFDLVGSLGKVRVRRTVHLAVIPVAEHVIADAVENTLGGTTANWAVVPYGICAFPR